MTSLVQKPSTAAMLSKRISYFGRILPGFMWQRFTRVPLRWRVHLIICLADHFEPAIVPEDGRARAPYVEQERRVHEWCRAYPSLSNWRDHDGHPFVHTYFYPAEQYERSLIDELAEHCHSGWGEIEVHLHHGVGKADTTENTRRILEEFRDRLARDHGCLSYMDGSAAPRYVFVHGNFALANSAGGRACGVDNEMQILAETGCYADMTLPATVFHWSQIGKINSLYECTIPLHMRAPHRKGRDLRVGQPPSTLPIFIQGPLWLYFQSGIVSRKLGVEAGAITDSNPPSLRRLELWKRAAISVKGRPDWLFIKLHCHGMDPTHREAVLGAAMNSFLRELVGGAAERNEVLHFVTAREMANIILAACDGKQGSPGDYRDYKLRLGPSRAGERRSEKSATVLGA